MDRTKGRYRMMVNRCSPHEPWALELAWLTRPNPSPAAKPRQVVGVWWALGPWYGVVQWRT